MNIDEAIKSGKIVESESWSIEDARMAVLLFKEGKKLSEIALIFKSQGKKEVTRSSVAGKIKRIRTMGVDVFRAGEENFGTCHADFSDGTIDEAIKLGIVRSTDAWPLENLRTLVNLWNAGLETGHIARQLGYSSDAIRSRICSLRLYGVRMNIRVKNQAPSAVGMARKTPRSHERFRQFKAVESAISNYVCETTQSDLSKDPIGCRWIEGDPLTTAWGYCNEKPTVVNRARSWCVAHLVRVYEAYTPYAKSQPVKIMGA